MTVRDEDVMVVVEPKVDVGVSRAVGGAFAEARARRGLSLEDASAHLKFGVSQLRALEQSDWSYFSKPVLLKGMIRNYAKFLDIDSEPILAKIEPLFATDIDVLEPLGRLETPLPKSGFFASIDRSWVSIRTLLMIVMAAIIVIAGLLFYSWGSSDVVAMNTENLNQETVLEGNDAVVPNSTPAPAPISAPVDVSPQTEAPAPVLTPAISEVTGVNLVLEAKGKSWVEVRGPDKEVLFSKMILAGESHQLTAPVGSNLVVGNIDVVTVTWKEKNLDLTSTERGSVARLTLN